MSTLIHQQAMFIHTKKQIWDRYAVHVDWAIYMGWLRDCRYDTTNNIGPAKGGRWYQRLTHDGSTYFAIVSCDGIHTILTKKIVRKTLGLKSL